MSINLNYNKPKVNASYKSLYLKNDLIKKIEEIAKNNNTSFNNIVVNMIEHCIEEENNS